MNKNTKYLYYFYLLTLKPKAIMKRLVSANRRLAELKGVALTIPNETIRISTLTLQEARESSLVENIVTTQDDLYRTDAELKTFSNASAKKVLNYRTAIQHGFDLVRKNHILTCNIIKEVQQLLEHNRAGFRQVSGTTLKRSDGIVVYTPPQDGKDVTRMMGNLEEFSNDNELLDLPILYLSRYITHNKAEYYRLIQAIRDAAPNNEKEWEEWTLFMLKGVEENSHKHNGIDKAYFFAYEYL